MRKFAAILFPAVVLAGVIWLIAFNKRTNFFRDLHGLIVSEIIDVKLTRIEESKPQRTHLERTVFRGMRAVDVKGREIYESRCFNSGLANEYRYRNPGIQQVRYFKYEELFYEVIYNEKKRMVAFLNCW